MALQTKLCHLPENPNTAATKDKWDIGECVLSTYKFGIVVALTLWWSSHTDPVQTVPWQAEPGSGSSSLTLWWSSHTDQVQTAPWQEEPGSGNSYITYFMVVLSHRPGSDSTMTDRARFRKFLHHLLYGGPLTQTRFRQHHDWQSQVQEVLTSLTLWWFSHMDPVQTAPRWEEPGSGSSCNTYFMVVLSHGPGSDSTKMGRARFRKFL